MSRAASFLFAAAMLCGVAAGARAQTAAPGLAKMSGQSSLLNVSFDPTRELYSEIDHVFPAIWKSKTGQALTIKTTHGGSGAQTRAVLEGLDADMVTLAVASDIDALAAKGLVDRNWSSRLPNESAPYGSVAVFLVRKGNPKHIRDWPDLVRSGVSVVTPNPKTSGGARWNFLAALGWAQRQPGANAASEEKYLRALYKNVAVLDTGTRGATTSFVERGIGDVLIGAENEAKLALQEFGGAGFEIVYPSVTILETAPVAVVDRVADRRGTRPAAEAYLKFLWTRQGQQIIARHYFRPVDPAVVAANAAAYPKVATFDIAAFGGWKTAQPAYFGDGGLFDRIIGPAPAAASP